jgi:hypothetical protein
MLLPRFPCLFRAVLFSSACLLLAPALPARAEAPPAAQPRSWLNPLRYRDEALGALAKVRPPEIMEMVLALVTGSEMGPGDGWFHPGQSRYGWAWLAARHGKGPKDQITAKEFHGPADLFERLDRNGDGVLTADDFDWSERSPYQRLGQMAGQWFALLDGDGNGRITKEEWDAFFSRASKGKGYVTPEDLRRALQPPKPPERPKDAPPMPVVLFKGLWDGELGSHHEGPSIGDRAPNFMLPTHDGREYVTLADYRGKKPVVLVFGSFT